MPDSIIPSPMQDLTLTEQRDLRIQSKRNLGWENGDMQSRLLAVVVMLPLTWIVSPFSWTEIPLAAISSLLTSVLGALLLMTGLVFNQKTHMAGITLLLFPSLMYFAVQNQAPYVGFSLGCIALLWLFQNVLTKKCGLNALLGINSCSSAE